MSAIVGGQRGKEIHAVVDNLSAPEPERKLPADCLAVRPATSSERWAGIPKLDTTPRY